MGSTKSSQRKLPEQLTLSTQERVELIATIIMEIIDDELALGDKSYANSPG